MRRAGRRKVEKQMPLRSGPRFWITRKKEKKNITQKQMVFWEERSPEAIPTEGAGDTTGIHPIEAR